MDDYATDADILMMLLLACMSWGILFCFAVTDVWAKGAALQVLGVFLSAYALFVSYLCVQEWRKLS